MKNRKSEFIITVAVCLLPIIAGLVLYNRLPDRIPTHFDINGNADNYSGKAFAVFGLPGLLAAIQVFLLFTLGADPKKKNMSPALRYISAWIVPVISVILNSMILGIAMGHSFPIQTVLPLLMGLLFILIGNYLPKTKQSYTMGFRLPWTLHSEENWNRTHRLAGFLSVAGGIVIVLTTLLQWHPVVLMLAALVLIALVPTVYSYLLYKKGI